MRDRSKCWCCPSPLCTQALLKRSLAAALAQGDAGMWGVTWSHPTLQGSCGVGKL